MFGALERCFDLPLRDAFAHLIDCAIESRREPGLESRFLAAYCRFGSDEVLEEEDLAFLTLFSRFLSERRSETRALDPDLSAFVIMHAIRGILVAATNRKGLNQDARLRAEILRLALGYVGATVDGDHASQTDDG